MQNRVGQDNFQLIVITHDERFAALIGTREHVEKLWRITKDVKQHTCVRAEALTD
jgi:DNA repair protein RAD50